MELAVCGTARSREEFRPRPDNSKLCRTAAQILQLHDLSICKDNPFALLLRCEITNHSCQVWVPLSGDMLNFEEDVLLGGPSIPS
jgi:hypothetical protein